MGGRERWWTNTVVWAPTAVRRNFRSVIGTSLMKLSFLSSSLFPLPLPSPPLPSLFSLLLPVSPLFSSLRFSSLLFSSELQPVAILRKGVDGVNLTKGMNRCESCKETAVADATGYSASTQIHLPLPDKPVGSQRPAPPLSSEHCPHAAGAHFTCMPASSKKYHLSND